MISTSATFVSDKNKDEERLTFKLDDAAVEERFSEEEVVVLIQILLKY